MLGVLGMQGLPQYNRIVGILCCAGSMHNHGSRTALALLWHMPESLPSDRFS